MARKTYSKRYAQAVFEIALEAGDLERWQSELEKIVNQFQLKRSMIFLDLL